MTTRTLLFATLLSALGGISQPAYAGLLSFWDFNETSGIIAHDSVGSVNGTLMGSAAFVSGGLNGNAVSISGAGSLVDMGDNFNFSNSSSYSLQVWVKLAPGDTTGYIPVARHHATTVAGYAMAINNIGDGCSAPPGTAHFYTEYPCSPASTLTVNDGNWHQLVGTFSGGVASIYVDGQFQGASSGTVLNQLNGYPFLVGGITVGSTPTNSYSGLIDNVGVWNNVLSAADVLSLYNTQGNPTALPEPGTIGLGSIGGGLLIGLARRKSR